MSQSASGGGGGGSKGAGGKDGSSKTPTATIKIAAKDASQRTGSGRADVGPGDPLAAPSVAPELVDIPRPPTASQLVVKSTNSRVIKTINDPVSLPKNSHLSSRTATAAAGPSSGGSGKSYGNPMSAEMAPRESTSSKALASGHSSGALRPASGSRHASDSGPGLSAANAGPASGELSSPSPSAGPSAARSGASGAASAEGAGASQAAASGASQAAAASGPDGSVKTTARFTMGPKSAGSAASASPASGSASPDGNVHDEVEEGEGEVEQPAESPGPGAGASPSAGSSGGAGLQKSAPSGGVDTAPASSGSAKLSPKTSGAHKTAASDKGAASSSASLSVPTLDSSAGGAKHGGSKKKTKKVTKFRYHKRITVRTHGKTSPSTIMDKVNKKDHSAALTPSTIGDMDPEELMKRAGIKGNKKAHWRVRLRQTKRLTKNGKTVTQTKVAYRDSEGNKRVKTVPGTECKQCGKKIEDCKCDDQ